MLYQDINLAMGGRVIMMLEVIYGCCAIEGIFNNNRCTRVKNKSLSTQSGIAQCKRVNLESHKSHSSALSPKILYWLSLEKYTNKPKKDGSYSKKKVNSDNIFTPLRSKDLSGSSLKTY